MKLKNNLYRILRFEDNVFTIELIRDNIIYRSHFPEFPITPGVCIIQIGGELLAEAYNKPLELKQVSNAKFLSVIDPDVTKEVSYVIKKAVTEIIDGEERIKALFEVRNSDMIFSKLSLAYKVS